MISGRMLAIAVLAGTAGAQTAPQELMDGGHYKRARKLVESRIQSNSGDAEALYLMASLKQISGDLPGAEKLAEKAVALSPRDARFHFRLAEITGQMAQRASIIHQVGLARRFKKEVDLALAIDPKHVGALRDEMAYYLHAPGIVGGDKEKARAIANQIMAIDPVEGYFAEIDLTDQGPDRTEAFLRKALEAQPLSYPALLRLGNFCESNKKPQEAEGYARAAIRVHPDRAGAHSLLASALVRDDKWSELDAALTQAEKDDPDNLFPYFRAANTCLARKVELPRGERYFRKYLMQEPELNGPSLASTRWRLGLLLEQQGRKQEAINEWQAAVKLDSSSHAAEELKRKR